MERGGHVFQVSSGTEAAPRGVEEASALMSLSYDRYLKAGDLYEGYDADQGGASERSVVKGGAL